MIAHKHMPKIAAALMAVAVCLCLVAAMCSGAVKKALGDSGVSMGYETALFDTSQPLTVNILMDEEDWQSMLDNATAETYYTCNVEINGEIFCRVGIRPKGNTSLTSIANDPTTDRYSFKLEFDQYVEGQTCYGLDKLVLNNNYADATYMKEALVYDMYRFLGADASLYNYAAIYVNGEYWGAYLALEAVEDSFLLRNYGAQSGALYKPEGVDADRGGKNDDNADGMKTAMQPEAGDADESADGMPDFTPFGGNGLTPPEGQHGTDDTNRPSPPQRPDEVGGEMGKTGESSAIPELPEDFTPGQTGGIFGTSGGADLNYTDDELDSYQTIWDGEVTDTSKADHRRVVTALKHAAEGTELDTYLDVDNLLKYMAVHVFSVNLDSLSGNMAHNYYLYESDGKLNLLPWDYNLAFGGFGGSADSVINSDISDPFAVTDFFDALLENETYRAQYEAYLRQLAEEYVQGGMLESFYTRTRSQIDQLVQDDPTAFYDYDAYDDAAQMLLQVVQLRGRSVLLQLSGAEETVDTTGIDLRIMGGMNGGFGGGEAPQGGPDRMS